MIRVIGKRPTGVEARVKSNRVAWRCTRRVTGVAVHAAGCCAHHEMGEKAALDP
ncbi:MAG: hypothetical protein KIT17_20020 [Rubrivivax sp.]|nr:hypothetical protein [Rubrivivax sp.]